MLTLRLISQILFTINFPLPFVMLRSDSPVLQIASSSSSRDDIRFGGSGGSSKRKLSSFNIVCRSAEKENTSVLDLAWLLAVGWSGKLPEEALLLIASFSYSPRILTKRVCECFEWTCQIWQRLLLNKKKSKKTTRKKVTFLCAR